MTKALNNRNDRNNSNDGNEKEPSKERNESVRIFRTPRLRAKLVPMTLSQSNNEKTYLPNLRSYNTRLSLPQLHYRTRKNHSKEGLPEMEKRPLIMAVDDEETLLKLLRVNLIVDGFDVITATDGRAALTMLEKQKPDLVLLDIMMPDLDGFQTLDLMRQRSDVPVIMLTARSETETLSDTLGLGADDYITKPFSLQVLAARIRAKLRRTALETPQPVKVPALA